MFQKEKKRSSTSSAKKTFIGFLVIVLLAAVWMLAKEQATLERVTAALQRNVTTSQQLDYQCRNLGTEAGQAQCEEALDKVRSALDQYESELEAAQQ